MVAFNYITFILLAIGGINWGLVGLLKFNLVDKLFGENSIYSRIIYSLVFFSALWLIISIIINNGFINFV